METITNGHTPDDHAGEPAHGDDRAAMGEWEPIRHRFKHLPIHIALLHTGKVLAFGGSGNDRDNFKQPLPAELWDPRTGAVQTVAQELAGDIFCAGHAFLPDGRLLVAGGTHGYDVKRFGSVPLPPFAGLEQAYLFDPLGERWTRVEDMSTGRWYPTLVTLGDGSILTMAGYTKHFPWVFLRVIEIYEPGQGWRKLRGAERWMPLYPRLHLLPNGEIFYAGSYNTHYAFPFVLWGFPTATLNPATGAWRTIGLPRTSEREEGMTMLLPLMPPDYQARVLLAGGGTPGGATAVPDAEIIDLSEPDPRWRAIAPMQHPRYYAYAVILPNRQVFVLGGRRGDTHHGAPGMPQPGQPNGLGESDPPQDPRAIHETELFDPGTEQWRPAATMQIDRLYHSNAILLPDGRVMVAGSNPATKVNELRIEIYRPPYLFQGPRPTIEDAPAQVAYGQEVTIHSPQAGQIEEVALIHPASTTHCLTTEQRYVGLAITARNSDTLRARIPQNPNLAPPGYYMLFLLNQAGVPSEARFVHLVPPGSTP
jgi:hypothetical protein